MVWHVVLRGENDELEQMIPFGVDEHTSKTRRAFLLKCYFGCCPHGGEVKLDSMAGLLLYGLQVYILNCSLEL